jgi:hypothetical protein
MKRCMEVHMAERNMLALRRVKLDYITDILIMAPYAKFDSIPT